MSRASIINSLVEFDRPLAELRHELAQLDWDWIGPPLAILRPGHIATVLKRYRSGQIGATDVEAWADLVECREDIEFDHMGVGDVADALFDIANPEMQGALDEIIDNLLAQLEPYPDALG